ncbi:MAG: hypothetical protein K5773_00215, partial [Pseudobutyrivibrio sp.]|nr:hypothetical protein [Pseudobutyrivibrio sp.]
NPTAGTKVATANVSYEVTSDDIGTWIPITATLSAVNSQDRYVYAGGYYSVVISSDEEDENVQFACKVPEANSSVTYTGSSDSVWTEASEYYGILQLGITETDTPEGSFTVTGTNIKDYYGKGDTDTLEATLSNSNITRKLTWASSDTSVIRIDDATAGEITALKAGQTTITASYNGEVKYSKTVNVLKFKINDVDPNEDTVSVDYTGSAIVPTVEVYTSDSADPTTVTPTCTNNIHASTSTSKASATFTYAGNEFTREFTIKPLIINDSVFTGATVSVSNGAITGFTGLGYAKKSDGITPSTVKPTYSDSKQDFAATITDITSDNDGIKYDITITQSSDDFEIASTTSTITKTFSLSAKQDISSDLGLTASLSRTTKTYDGSPITADHVWSWVSFKDSEGNGSTIINSSTADISITDNDTNVTENISSATGTNAAVNVGNKTITFTMKDDNAGYTGSISVSFRVLQASIDNATVIWTKDTTAAFGSFAHTGEPIEPEAGTDFVVKLGNEVLTPGTDYTVSYPIAHTNTGLTSLLLTGAGTNITSTKSVPYFITVNYAIDMEIDITYGGITYDATYADRDSDASDAVWASGCEAMYDPSGTRPSISVYMPGIGILDSTSTDPKASYKIYSDKTCQTEVAAADAFKSLGTKYIKVTLESSSITAANGATAIAKFDVVERTITDSSITVKKESSSSTKTFTGSETSLASTDLTIKCNGTALTMGTDYEIVYTKEDRTNVTASNSPVTYQIVGKGNYKGTRTSSSYTYAITPAEVTKTSGDSSKAYVAIDGATNVSYTGLEQVLPITLTLNNVTYYSTSSLQFFSDNIDISAVNNVSVGTATMTITGKNNLTGSAVLTFTISKNTEEYTITIEGKEVSTFAITSNATDGYRYYTCPLDYTFTGSALGNINNVVVKDGNGQTLEQGSTKAYRARFYDNVNAYTASPSADASANNSNNVPRLVILGVNNYAGNNAIVYFTINQRDISECTITDADGHAGTEDDPYPLAFSTGTLSAADLTTKYNVTNIASADNVTVGEIVTSTADDSLSVTLTGTNNLTGTVTKYYSVGTNLDDVDVTLKSYDTTSHDMAEVTATNGIYKTYFRNDVSPEVTFTDLTKDTHYSVGTPVETTGTGDVIKTVAITYTGIGSNGYYGTKTITYTVNKINLSNEVSTTGDTAITLTEGDYNGIYYYTGSDITYAPSMYLTYGNGDDGDYDTSDASDDLTYTLVSGTDYTMDPSSLTVFGTDKAVTVTGQGNFTGSNTAFKYTLKQGFVKIYVGNDTNLAIDQSTGLGYGLSTYPEVLTDSDTSNNVTTATNLTTALAYEYTGSTITPTLYISNVADTAMLDESEYTITYTTSASTSAATVTPKDPGTYYAKIEINPSNNNSSICNYAHQIIFLPYTITTNSIDPNENENVTATIADLPYKAEAYTTAQLVNKMTVKAGNKNLTYGTDFALATTDDDLSKIKEAYAGDDTQANTLVGTNINPDYSTDFSTDPTENWVWIKGINKYSGYRKVNFNIYLDINNSTSQPTNIRVAIAAASYTLDNESSAVPVVKYLYDGTYTEVSSISNYVTVARTDTGIPGPDSAMIVTGKGGLIQGTYRDALYYESDTDTTGDKIKFLADLSTYSGIVMTSAENVAYTGDYVAATFKGLYGTQDTSTNGQTAGTDYYIVYVQSTTSTDESNVYGGKEVGKWYPIIHATANSNYYIANTKTTAGAYSFNVKYNLNEATMTFIDDNGATITQAEFVSTGYDIQSHVRITINDGDVTLYDGRTGAGVAQSYITINGGNDITQYGDIPVIARPTTDGATYVMGSCTSTIKITGNVLNENDFTVTLQGYITDNENHYYYIPKSKVAPSVVVKKGTTTLTLGTDYTLSYLGNDSITDSSTHAYVVVTGINKFSGSIQKEYYIDPLPADKLTVTTINATYSGTYVDPDASSKTYVHPMPSYIVTYQYDNKTVILDEGTHFTASINDDANTGGVSTSATAYLKGSDNSLSDKPATLTIAGNGTTITGTKTAGYGIDILDITPGSNNSVKAEITNRSAQYTGQAINVLENLTIKVGDVKLMPDKYNDATDDNTADYKVLITNESGVETDNPSITNQGTYNVKISGKNNCTGYIETTFTVTKRSLPDNFHYWFETGSQFSKSTTTWTYSSDLNIDDDTSTPDPGYILAPSTSDNTVEIGGKEYTDTLTIKVDDLESGDQSKFRITISDSGKLDDSTLNGNGEDYKIEFVNLPSSGSAKWLAEDNEDDPYHAEVADTSPAVKIIGCGDYEGEIIIPFNVGTSLEGLKENDQLTVTYDNLLYTYNGKVQKPTVSIINQKSGAGLVEGQDYELTITTATGADDEGINVGNKLLYINGINNYCGQLDGQAYTIKKKVVTASPYLNTSTASEFTNENPMLAYEGDSYENNTGTYKFTLSADGLSRMDENTSKTLFGTTNYKGYYYAVYDGEIEPSVTVVDSEIGEIASNEISVTYTNSDVACETLATATTTSVTPVPAKATVKFAATAADNTTDSLNYYGDPSAVYVIDYLIIPKNFDATDYEVSITSGDLADAFSYTGVNIEPTVSVYEKNTDGTLLSSSEYTVSYDDEHVLPGTHTITITGNGNYTGTLTTTYLIRGDLSTDTVVYYKDATTDQYVQGIPQLLFAEEDMNPDNLFLAASAKGTDAAKLSLEERKLTFGTDYTRNGLNESNSTFASDVTVHYTGNNNQWTGAKDVYCTIKFDKTKVKVVNYEEEEYYYNGNPQVIAPELNINADITNLEYTIDGTGIEADDVDLTDSTQAALFTNAGTIEVEFDYTFGTESDHVTSSYEILPLTLADNTDGCTIIYSKSIRYTKAALKPSVVIWFTAEDGSRVSLVENQDYTLSYGTNIEREGSLTITGSGNATGTVSLNFNIKVGTAKSLTMAATASSEDTSLTATWRGDTCSDGVQYRFTRVDNSGNETLVKSGMIARNKSLKNLTMTKIFSGLDSSSTYKIKVRSYAVDSNNAYMYSDWREATATTKISQSTIEVTSTSVGKVKIDWSQNTNSDVVQYRIYRASDATSAGKELAVFPASAGSYTNSTEIVSGQTYYYYVEGFVLKDGAFVSIGESEHEAVTVL